MTEEIKAVKKSKPSTTKGRPLTVSQSAEAIALWKSGDVSLADLADRFGKSINIFTRLFKKEGVAKGESASEHAKRVTIEIEKSAVDDIAEITKRIRDTKDNSYKLGAYVERAFTRELAEAEKSKTAISLRHANIKALLDIAKGAQITKELRYSILGLDKEEKADPDEIPELQITELTAEEIKQINITAMVENQDNDFDIPDIEFEVDELGDEPEKGVTT